MEYDTICIDTISTTETNEYGAQGYRLCAETKNGFIMQREKGSNKKYKYVAVNTYQIVDEHRLDLYKEYKYCITSDGVYFIFEKEYTED